MRDPHLNGRGVPKIAYTTEDEAQKAIPSATPHQRMWEPAPYHCPACGQWHIGNGPLLPEWPLRTLGATVALADTTG